ncbi:MAG: hypothetical protein M1819_005697 [Sarea resinae]|nr:MAG: hypothetical protein M1819_005697 [Sarea resinae]
MSDQGDLSGSWHQAASSGNPSPTDARTPAIHSQSTNTTETTEGDMSSTGARRTGGSYGSFASSALPRTDQQESSSQDDRSPGQDRRVPKLHSGEPSLRQRVLSSDPGSIKQRKPGMARRASSNVQSPYRGQEFSVDDALNEVEAMVQRQDPGAESASGFNSLRRQPSTLRRRPTAQPSLPRVESSEVGETEQTHAGAPTDPEVPQGSSGEDGTTPIEQDVDADDDDADLSDAESFTLKDRQQAINETHPFGIRIWKPALYKKNRSVQQTAEGDIHSSPGGRVSNWLWVFNVVWTVLFGWWLALASLFGAVACFVVGFAPGCADYGRVFLGLAGYLFFPFGQFVKLRQDEAYAEEDEGEGRSISEYEQWQNGDLEGGRLFFGPIGSGSLIGRRRNSVESASETDSLLGRTRRSGDQDRPGSKSKRRLFGRGQWTTGRVIFFFFFYGLLTPLMLLVSGICWLMVFWIPMGRVILLLLSHLRRHPLALSFHSDSAYSREPDGPSSSILLCSYRAVGLKYWKYTVDGTNIFLINLLAVVLFAIFDYWVLDVALGLSLGVTHPAFIFTISLLSIIPLAYFIGQAVASISAQSSMGLGAAINAFFSTVVEVFLYCVALKQGKGQLVEGSIIGSIFAGILLLPGLSMCFGAIKRKTQRFNVRSAGVTSTMLLFAVIAAFCPTLFYQIYGTHQLNCHACNEEDMESPNQECRRCFFTQIPAVNDRFFTEAVRPYCWFAAVLLFLSYVIGLLFTLRTHAAVIWNTEIDEKKLENSMSTAFGSVHPEHRHSGASDAHGTLTRQYTSSGGTVSRSAIRESQLYKRILGQSLKQVGLGPENMEASRVSSVASGPQTKAGQPPHLVPPKPSGADAVAPDNASSKSIQIHGLSEEENTRLVRQVAEMAATAATVAARDATRAPRKTSAIAHAPARTGDKPQMQRSVTGTATIHDNDDAVAAEALTSGGTHDAPNWSRAKSTVILLGATFLYAIIAEILVNTVDVVLESVDIDEKFLGITLFALVPNTTEFLNAISFAMNGNIALSMEIGSAYALQVCLLQIPALVLFSAVSGRYIDPADLVNHTFSLIFPQWDMVTVILCVFLLSYMYGEGKSNYFKGSIMIMSYLVVMVGFYFSGLTDVDLMGTSRFDTPQPSIPPISGPVSTSVSVPRSFRTIGRGKVGRAY